nr:3499_t:CDS:2 [Entrophospora candida]
MANTAFVTSVIKGNRSSEEFSAMGATLTEQYYVKEEEKATTNYVPAVAVRRRWRTLSGIIGRKGAGEVNGTQCGAVKCVDILKNTNNGEGKPYQGLTCWAKLGKPSGGYPNTGAAWPSSVRAVRCMVKSYNERNPYA